MTDVSLRWLRLWTDVIEDEKLLLLSPSDRWYFVAICALKRTGMLDEDETAEVRDRKVALRLRLEPTERDELRRRLIEARLVDATWQPKGWEKRQFESDDSTTRVRKWRRKQKRNGNVTATLSQRSCNASDTDTDTDTEQNKNPLPLGLDPVAWSLWQSYRKLKPASIQLAQKKLAAFGADQLATVEQSIANGWKGLFALKADLAPRKPVKFRTPEEIEAEEVSRAQH